MSVKRKNINLTLPSDLVEKAKNLEMNLSQAAEKGILREIKQRLQEKWLRENQKQIKQHNNRIQKSGPLLTPLWEK